MANRCETCARDFDSEQALQQHNADKHAASMPSQAAQSKPQGKGRGKLLAVGLVLIVIIVVGAFFLLSQKQATTGAVTGAATSPDSSDISSAPSNPNAPEAPAAASLEEAKTQAIPSGGIHWHPILKIYIKGQSYLIPTNVGLGSIHLPIHTHDTTGTLHYENTRPTFENMRLGYFFEQAWGKKFNSTCIFSYCNGPDGTVRFYVNGQLNNLYDNYIPHDGEQLEIRYE